MENITVPFLDGNGCRIGTAVIVGEPDEEGVVRAKITLNKPLPGTGGPFLKIVRVYEGD